MSATARPVQASIFDVEPVTVVAVFAPWAAMSLSQRACGLARLGGWSP